RLCIAASVIVYFAYHRPWLLYWTAAVVFVIGSILDVLDGALARHGGKATPFGAFLDSISDRVSEGFMLTAIALVFAREGNDIAIAFTIAAMAGSFLVSYARATAGLLGRKGDVGLGSRAGGGVVMAAGLPFAPGGRLPGGIFFLAATGWFAVLPGVL